MNIRCWAAFSGSFTDEVKTILLKSLSAEGLQVVAPAQVAETSAGVCFASSISAELHDLLRSARNAGSSEIIVILGPQAEREEKVAWDLLGSGASDVLLWSDPDQLGKQAQARLERCHVVEELLASELADDIVVGRSATWRAALSNLVGVARFSDTATLILGESGTGKEVAAKLIHRMDGRAGKRDLVVQDCSTLVQDLSGSEFFGHERGAFTGAASDRQGAFALAHGGTLFLDEVGELPLPVQAQLLRAIQEGTYKRVGGTIWHRTNFRLVCATNRDLESMVGRGEFRADLYHRIAGHVCWMPPLRDRLEDVLPLARFFVRQMRPALPAPTLDPMVCDYLIRRDYPGNVRELRQVVGRLMNRCGKDGMISIGCVPENERPSGQGEPHLSCNAAFETAIRRAVVLGVGLKDIGRAAEDCAIRCAVAAENGSIKHAAHRLGVTDRALQMRRVQLRGTDASRPNPGRLPELAQQTALV